MNGNEQKDIRKVAFVGDYLPRKCGIATFTSDLLSAIAAEPNNECFAVPVNDIEAGYEYPEVVRFEIAEQELTSYQRAADFLNMSNVEIVSVQHEFGIYGGPAGGHLLTLLRELRMPVITTFHTVLLEPNSDQRRVMQELLARSARVGVVKFCRRSIARRWIKSTSSPMAFMTCRSSIRIITRTSLAWKARWCS